tara:strand:- start:549 stop:737 length:189 start_codon:yes stop_codon:yes gene_type:complete
LIGVFYDSCVRFVEKFAHFFVIFIDEKIEILIVDKDVEDELSVAINGALVNEWDYFFFVFLA